VRREFSSIWTHRISKWKGKAADSKYDKCAVRNRRFRFVNNTELYDIKDDPQELKNIADKNRAVLADSAGPDRFAYAGVVGVGTTREEGLRRANLAADYVRTSVVVAEPFTNPPGYNSIGANVAIMQAGPRGHRIVKDRQGNRTALERTFSVRVTQ
jgi:hypothetical protein